MGEDEEGTRGRFNAHLADLIEPTIASRRGRIVKTTGDALLVEFASVVDAVQCAVEIQKGMAERNADEPTDRRIDFRVGVNLSDVIIEGDDIHGDGVNIAARLEALADPGGEPRKPDYPAASAGDYCAAVLMGCALMLGGAARCGGITGHYIPSPPVTSHA